MPISFYEASILLLLSRREANLIRSNEKVASVDSFGTSLT
jgi:hypothetical protein